MICVVGLSGITLVNTDPVEFLGFRAKSLCKKIMKNEKLIKEGIMKKERFGQRDEEHSLQGANLEMFNYLLLQVSSCR